VIVRLKLFSKQQNRLQRDLDILVSDKVLRRCVVKHETHEQKLNSMSHQVVALMRGVMNFWKGALQKQGEVVIKQLKGLA